ncbi:MAG: hypothetical protein QNJ37_20105 [Crocosphaera sp.]|nr:hypothetical protein [Crocosphaera sp.]
MTEQPQQRNIAEILAQLQTSTQLLGLFSLLLESILVVCIWKLEGTTQLVAIILGLMNFPIAIWGVIYLERSRIRFDSVSNPSLSSPETEIQYEYDVFLSAPMDSWDDDNDLRLNREKIIKIKAALRKFCGLELTFYAGTDIENRAKFQAPSVALRQNFEKMGKSKKFIMIYPEPLASSILLEAGMALALRKDSVWFVHDRDQLPYLLREASNASRQNGLPSISIYQCPSIDDVLKTIEQDGKDIFKKG